MLWALSRYCWQRRTQKGTMCFMAAICSFRSFSFKGKKENLWKDTSTWTENIVFKTTGTYKLSSSNATQTFVAQFHKELALLCSSFWQDTAACLLWSTARGEWHKGRDELLHQIMLWQIIKSSKSLEFYLCCTLIVYSGPNNRSPLLSPFHTKEKKPSLGGFDVNCCQTRILRIECLGLI